MVLPRQQWTWTGQPRRLLETIGDAALGEIVGRHFYQHLVAGEHTDTVLAHAAGGVGDDLVLVFELDAEGRVRKQLRHDAREFQQFLFRHSVSSVVAAACRLPRLLPGLALPSKSVNGRGS